MKKAFYIALVAAGLLAPLPLEAAQQYDTQEKAAENATDDGYILFVYGKGWDRYSEDLCKKVIAAPEISRSSVCLFSPASWEWTSPDVVLVENSDTFTSGS